MLAIYWLLCESLNMVVGRTGRLLLAQPILFAMGAYSVAILTGRFGLRWELGLLIGIILAGALGFLIGVVFGGLQGDSFILATLGIQLVFHSILSNWVTVTGGPFGIHGIAPPEFMGWSPGGINEFGFFAVALAGLVLFLLWRVQRKPFGRSLLALREDEISFQTTGRNPKKFVSVALLLCGISAATAGSLYASYSSYIDGSVFSLSDGVLLLSVIIVGGAGTSMGSLAGAILFVLVPEVLRFVPVTTSGLAAVRDIIFGLLLLAFLRLRPHGILGDYPLD